MGKQNKKKSKSPLQIVAQYIARKQFSDAILHLSAYADFSGKPQAEKRLIVENLDQVLTLAHTIFLSDQASFSEKIQACKFCQTIYLARIIIHVKKLNAEPDSVTPEVWNATVDAANFYSKAILRESAKEVLEEMLKIAEEKARKIEEEKKRLIEAFLKKGDDAFLKKDFELAIANYKTVIEKDPSVVQAHFSMARSYKRLGEKIQQGSTWGTRRVFPGGECLAEIVITTPEQDVYYQQSSTCFATGIRLLGSVPAEALIYRELGHLQELLGRYDLGVQYYKKASQIEKQNFNDFYLALIEEEFRKKVIKIVFRYAYVFRDQKFIGYINKKLGVDVEFRFYLDCASIYANLVEANTDIQLNSTGMFLKKCLANSAIQHLLVAILCDNIPQAQIDNVFSDYLASLEEDVDRCVFSNIFNMLPIEKLQRIKQAYVRWMMYNLDHLSYQSAVNKYELICDDEDFAGLLSAEFLSKMATAYTKIKHKNLETALSLYQLAFEKDPVCVGLQVKIDQLLRLQALRSERQEKAGAVLFYTKNTPSLMYPGISNQYGDGAAPHQPQRSETSSCI